MKPDLNKDIHVKQHELNTQQLNINKQFQASSFISHHFEMVQIIGDVGRTMHRKKPNNVSLEIPFSASVVLWISKKIDF